MKRRGFLQMLAAMPLALLGLSQAKAKQREGVRGIVHIRTNHTASLPCGGCDPIKIELVEQCINDFARRALWLIPDAEEIFLFWTETDETYIANWRKLHTPNKPEINGKWLEMQFVEGSTLNVIDLAPQPWMTKTPGFSCEVDICGRKN